MALQIVGGKISKEGMSRLTTEYVYWPIVTDTTIDESVTAELAFVDDSKIKPSTGDWTGAEIVVNPDDVQQNALRLLIGPEGGDKDLTPSTQGDMVYHVWVRISSGEERIVRRAGTLKIR